MIPCTYAGCSHAPMGPPVEATLGACRQHSHATSVLPADCSMPSTCVGARAELLGVLSAHGTDGINPPHPSSGPWCLFSHLPSSWPCRTAACTSPSKSHHHHPEELPLLPPPWPSCQHWATALVTLQNCPAPPELLWPNSHEDLLVKTLTSPVSSGSMESRWLGRKLREG